MRQNITHIIGAGLAGLSAATRLAECGHLVVVYEASGQAGGRCRSYEDTAFGGIIDNGNHLLLSGNEAAFSYLRRIGSKAFSASDQPAFPFMDAKTKEQWTVHATCGALPRWLLDPHYRRVLPPVLLSALNTDPKEASKRLIWAIVRSTLLKGARACRPFVAEELGAVFIDPALHYLTMHKGQILFQRRLKQIHFEGSVASMLDFGETGSVALGPDDTVICAVPPWIAPSLLPSITAPDEYRAILNAHFRITPPASMPRMIGVVGGMAEWIFIFPNRISITISDADRLMQEDREILATSLWQEISALTGLASPLPPWQIVKEKRATFAATPKQDAKRPDTRTPWKNVYLAGDWVQTGLPSTIEGAIMSGERAASLILENT